MFEILIWHKSPPYSGFQFQNQPPLMFTFIRYFSPEESMVYLIFWSLYLLMGTGRDILRWSTAHAPLMTNNIRNMMGGGG